MNKTSDELKPLLSAVSNLIVLQIVSLLVMVVGGGYLYHSLKNDIELMSVDSAETAFVEDWQRLEKTHNASTGADDASIVILEFADYQCPFCKEFSTRIKAELFAEYADDLRIVFKHFPLEQIHPDAMLSAIAAQCALREQKFTEIEMLFFENQDDLKIEALLAHGQSVGLGERYRTCLESRATQTEVERDMRDGMAAGVKGTPTFLVNGMFIEGAASLQTFKTAIAAALQSSRQ